MCTHRSTHKYANTEHSLLCPLNGVVLEHGNFPVDIKG